MFILDTDHLSFLERASHPIGDRILARMKNAPDRCFATIASYEEQTRGWLARIAQTTTPDRQISVYSELKRQLRNYCDIAVVEFDAKAVLEFTRLRQSGVRIGSMDLKIASIALANDATVLTRNTRDFSQVPNLKFEDWSI